MQLLSTVIPRWPVKLIDQSWLLMGAMFLQLGMGQAQAQTTSAMPFMADCVLRQQSYLHRTTAAFDPADRAQIFEAYEAEKKRYTNVQSQPDTAWVVAQIKSHIETLSQPGLPPQSIRFTQDNLELQESMLCWMDYFARRPYSFSAAARAAYVAELRAQQEQAKAAEMAREAARPDDPKTVGRGARGG